MVDLDQSVQNGSFDPKILADEDVYREELEKVFRHTWLYVGHESQIPKPGDYLLNYMGEEEIVVLKDPKANIRVFKNWCPHRGNKVCLFDRGNAKGFTCTFHGWTFDLNGMLTGLGAGRQVYGSREKMVREAKTLPEVPKVSSYNGLIFASWDNDICPLEDYLGNIRPYLDVVATRPWSGGVEVLPGRARWNFPINWKAIAENWITDDYHVWTTHASFFRVAKALGPVGALVSSYLSPEWAVQHTVNALVVSPAGAPHALGAASVWGDPRPGTDYHHGFIEKTSRQMAAMMGKEALDWYDESSRLITEYFRQDGVAKLCSMGNMTVFPNFSLEFLSMVLGGVSLIQWHPRGASLHEGWEWVVVDKNAPDCIKRFGQISVGLGQSPGGMIMIDDTENFERSRDNLLSALSYKDSMEAIPLSNEALGNEEYLKEFEKIGVDLKKAFPGAKVLPGAQEEASRAFYAYWKALMLRPSTNSITKGKAGR
jgi:phenylpropionate dioxygenase-like ring-hydroxylating dioxygenase large terminal subunit